MNQALLKRLFNSLPSDEEAEVVKVAKAIIADEKKKGHATLAQNLERLLSKKLTQTQETQKGKVVNLHDIPTDRRYNVPLATQVARDSLRHHMILSPEIESKIGRIEEEYAGRKRLAQYGLKPRKKILFYGSPGCGKSMSAERIAWNLGLPFLKVRFEAILSSFLGESAGNIKGIFDAIHEFPCVLLLDEFDYIGKTRNSKNEVGEMHRIVNILLHLMEEYDAPGLLIATTNLEGSIDHALFRRFDDIIELPLPSEQEIIELLKTTLSAIETSPKLNLVGFAKKIKGYSASIVVKIAQDAAKGAVLTNSLPVKNKHLEQALLENPEVSE